MDRDRSSFQIGTSADSEEVIERVQNRTRVYHLSCYSRSWRGRRDSIALQYPHGKSLFYGFGVIL